MLNQDPNKIADAASFNAVIDDIKKALESLRIDESASAPEAEPEPQKKKAAKNMVTVDLGEDRMEKGGHAREDEGE